MGMGYDIVVVVFGMMVIGGDGDAVVYVVAALLRILSLFSFFLSVSDEGSETRITLYTDSKMCVCVYVCVGCEFLDHGVNVCVWVWVWVWV